MGASEAKGENWQKDSDVSGCCKCNVSFSLTTRRHHCRKCGLVVCSKCSRYRINLSSHDSDTPKRVCRHCFHTLRKNGAAGFETGVGSSASTGGWGLDGSVSPTTEKENTADDTNFETPDDEKAPAAEDCDSINCCFVGAGCGGCYGEGADAYYDAGTLYSDPITALSDVGEKTALQTEKERLLQQWTEIRQNVVFVDIQLQEVERVGENTPVGYCQEVENIMLQPELPERLRTMFPFPRGGEGNMELLMKPLEPITALTCKSQKEVSDALRQVTAQLQLSRLPNY
ncbi:zinc finger protein [Trypanosoma brucei equiperdum]|uniref:Zinc finger protein n=1 Tax=Trypanosoma brucei equiperdum TaxID=630700 RepID=A0A3L6L395_9TRYP|nr:zinc finger protein [Trypanosoma brucei equiperdum]